MKNDNSQQPNVFQKFSPFVFPYQIIDLTHSLKESIPCWDGGCGFYHETTLDYKDCLTDVKFRIQKMSMEAGIGTHVDAPAHCIPNGLTIDNLLLTNLTAPCAVIDVSERAHERYRVSVGDIEAYENKYGHLRPGQFIMIRTGWERFWSEPEKYHNQHLFPSVSKEAAHYLLQRNIIGLGIDTLSPDRPEDGYPVHAALLGAGKYIVENIANSIQLPPIGSFIIILPLKITGGTEAPARVIALIENR